MDKTLGRRITPEDAVIDGHIDVKPSPVKKSKIKLRIMYSSDFTDEQRVAIVNRWASRQDEYPELIDESRSWKLKRLYPGLMLGKFSHVVKLIHVDDTGMNTFRTRISDATTDSGIAPVFIFNTRDQLEVVSKPRNGSRGRSIVFNGKNYTIQELASHLGVPSQKISHILHQSQACSDQDCTDIFNKGTDRSGGLYKYNGKLTYLCYITRSYTRVPAIQVGKWLQNNGFKHQGCVENFFKRNNILLGADNESTIVTPGA